MLTPMGGVMFSITKMNKINNDVRGVFCIKMNNIKMMWGLAFNIKIYNINNDVRGGV